MSTDRANFTFLLQKCWGIPSENEPTDRIDSRAVDSTGKNKLRVRATRKKKSMLLFPYMTSSLRYSG